MDYIIETKGLTKRFGHTVAADNINMHIQKGDIYGFIGKNGAGKTTTMKLILGLLTENSGEITLFGSSDLDKERHRIGSLIEAPGLFNKCSAYENLKRFSILYGGDDEEIHNLLKLVGLSNVGKRPAGKFSLGMKQRLGIAIAMLGNPEILILDEPINGLDPAGIKDVRDTIIRLNQEKGVTFLISSHLLDELSKITTRYGIVNNGVLIEEIEAEDLYNRCQNSLMVRVDNIANTLEVLKANNLVDKYEVNDDVITIFNHVENSHIINKTLVNNNITVYEIYGKNTGLEDYFIERIGK